MGFKYAVIGAGRQGTAAVYDLAKFGEAEQIIMVDVQEEAAENSAERINAMVEREVVKAKQADASKPEQLTPILRGISGIISALPYDRNLAVTELAIKNKVNMVDLGGNTDIVRSQIRYDSEARKAGITIIPDCGMGPGMNISLAVYAMSLLDNPEEVLIWDGGLPRNPKPPWNYALTFNIAGLTNEYSGNAYFIRDSKVVEVPCFEGYEELDFPEPLNRLEAFVTSGGLSTMPWTYEGKLARLENKTLRYPGHWAQFRSFAELGLFDLEPVRAGRAEFVPRDVLHRLLEPKITKSGVEDVAIIRIKCIGEKEGQRAQVTLELIDYYDKKTDFTAMQRLTGWHASIVAILAARGEIPKGALPIEKISGKLITGEARRRGFTIKEEMTPL